MIHIPRFKTTVGDHRPREDLPATRSIAARFWTCYKTWLRLIWSKWGPRLAADLFATSPIPGLGNLMWPLWSVEIVGRVDFSLWLQRICHLGLWALIRQGRQQQQHCFTLLNNKNAVQKMWIQLTARHIANWKSATNSVWICNKYDYRNCFSAKYYSMSLGQLQ